MMRTRKNNAFSRAGEVKTTVASGARPFRTVIELLVTGCVLRPVPQQRGS